MPITPQNRNFMARGVLYMLSMCIPITASLILNKPDVALLGALGALFALFIAPRYRPLLRTTCIGAGGLPVAVRSTGGRLDLHCRTEMRTVRTYMF